MNTTRYLVALVFAIVFGSMPFVAMQTVTDYAQVARTPS